MAHGGHGHSHGGHGHSHESKHGHDHSHSHGGHGHSHDDQHCHGMSSNHRIDLVTQACSNGSDVLFVILTLSVEIAEPVLMHRDGVWYSSDSFLISLCPQMTTCTHPERAPASRFYKVRVFLCVRWPADGARDLFWSSIGHAIIRYENIYNHVYQASKTAFCLL